MKGLVASALILSMCCLWTAQPAQAKEDSRPITAWPVIYYRADKENAETDVLWPFFRYEREEERTSYALRPFVFSTQSDRKEDSRQTSILWPLNGYSRTRTDLSLHIFPVYWYGKSEGEDGKYGQEHNIIFPLYWDGKGENYSYFHLWPFFGANHQGPGYTEYSTIYPFFRYGNDTQSDRLDLDIPWPLIGLHHEGDYSSRRFLPLYWSEKGSDYRGGFIFPYYWRQTPSYRSRGVFPLWYASCGPKLQTDLLFPLYFNRKTPQEHLRLITPFSIDRQWIDKQQQKNHLNIFIPFYFDYEDERGDLKFITPLYVSNQTKESSLSTFVPFYLNYEEKDMRLKVILPGYAHYRSGTFTSSSVFPVYYHSMDKQLQSELTYYFPLYGEYRKGDAVSRHFIFFPLFSKTEDSELHLQGWDVAWPFFHYEKSPTTFSFRAMPLYWRTRSADSGMTIGFPLYWSFRHGENRYTHLVPLYGNYTKGDWYRKRFILGPLFMDTQDDRSGLSRQDIIFPLYSRLQEPNGDQRRSWLLPFFYHRHEAKERLTLGSVALLPPYYINWKKGDQGEKDGDKVEKNGYKGEKDGDNEDKDKESLFHLWPFYGKLQKGAYNEYSTLWPLFRLGSDPKSDTRLVHLLLYYHEAEKERELSAFFPLWWHGETPQTTHDMSPLLHWYENDKKEDKKSIAFLWLYPPEVSLVKYQEGPGRVRHALFPLYHYDRNESKDSLRWTFLWPLFSCNSQGGEEFSRQTSFLWKVISYEQKGQENSEFRFLWKLIRSKRTDTSYTFEFNPLYYHESGSEGESYWAILGGLLGVETRKDQRKRVRFFWIFG